MRQPSEKPLRQTSRDTYMKSELQAVCFLKDSDDGVLEYVTGVLDIVHHLRLSKNLQRSGKWICRSLQVERGSGKPTVVGHSERSTLCYWLVTLELLRTAASYCFSRNIPGFVYHQTTSVTVSTCPFCRRNQVFVFAEVSQRC
jgi:hypothetical protein